MVGTNERTFINQRKIYFFAIVKIAMKYHFPQHPQAKTNAEINAIQMYIKL